MALLNTIKRAKLNLPPRKKGDSLLHFSTDKYLVSLGVNTTVPFQKEFAVEWLEMPWFGTLEMGYTKVVTPGRNIISEIGNQPRLSAIHLLMLLDHQTKGGPAFLDRRSINTILTEKIGNEYEAQEWFVSIQWIDHENNWEMDSVRAERVDITPLRRLIYPSM